jgi:DNA-binding HxlR family transcriptional regulator
VSETSTSTRKQGRPRQLPPRSEVLGECVADDEEGRRVREVLDRVADKWSMLVIVRLREGGTMRFGQLGRAVGGISQRMLTLTLRQLERDGLILRTSYAEVPLRVEYTLTELGTSLTDPLIALARWALVNYPIIEMNRASHDAATRGEAPAPASTSSGAARTPGRTYASPRATR